MTMATFEPRSPPVIPTPENFLEGVIVTKCDMIFCVPSFTEVCFKYEHSCHELIDSLTQAWIRSPENLPELPSLRTIVSN